MSRYVISVKEAKVYSTLNDSIKHQIYISYHRGIQSRASNPLREIPEGLPGSACQIALVDLLLSN